LSNNVSGVMFSFPCGAGAMERSVLRFSKAHTCLLAFTSALLLCEIVVGRLCKSLINTVDSFHTLSVLVRIMLHPSLIRAGACVTSTPGPNACADPRERAQQRLPVRVPDSARMPSPHAVLPEAAGIAPAAFEGARYSVLRLRPFGALVSDLLLACLCVSFLLEILSHTLQPRPIRRPLLATVVGAVSLLFNGLMLVWRRGRGTDAGADGSSTSPPAIQYNHFNTTKNKGHGHSSSEASGSMLMFCNLRASNVQVPDRASQKCFLSFHKCPDTPTAHTSDSPHQSSHAEDAISHDSTGFQVSQHTFCLTGPRTEVANNNICVGCTVPSVSSRPPASGWCNQDSSRTGQQWQDIIWRTVTMIQGLLASVLVLVNGLLPLTLGPDCLPSLWGCHLLMYMDPGFSTLTVLVLLVGTLPELRRYGLVLLQACPAHVHAQELSAHVGRVSGVIAVHELHVWQLSALQLVASVHVHCLSGLGPLEYSGLLTAVTDVLKGFGLSHCTVQLEFLESASSQGQSTKTAMANSAEQTPCSLHCGEKCAKMMCCSPPQEQSCSTAPSSMDVEVKQQDIVVENTYLHIASFLSIFKLAVICLIILGKDPFTFFRMETPGIWVWGQENKIYACMMVFFLSNMIENQCMSTGAFEISLNDVPVWSKLESGHLPSMQQLVQILENELKLNAHMDTLPLQRS
ncbi:hypothetical protein P4O66_018702, partial [Electrophorus voltai]